MRTRRMRMRMRMKEREMKGEARSTRVNQGLKTPNINLLPASRSREINPNVLVAAYRDFIFSLVSFSS